MELQQYPDKALFLKLAEKGNVIPVCLEILADTETPVSLLLKQAAGKGPLFLLESVEGGERWARYSFLGFGGEKVIRVFRDVVEIHSEKGSRSIVHEGDPLAVLRKIMAAYRPVSLPRLPRFWGGLVGYFTYEMASFFERIQNELPENQPLAGFVLTDKLFIFDNVRHTLTLISHAFVQDGETPLTAYDRAVQRLGNLRATLQKPMPKGKTQSLPARIRPRNDPVLYKRAVARVKEYIHAGDVIQTVISQPFVCGPAPDPKSLYRAQRYINPSPYMFYLEMDGKVLVGSSPETLVRLENGVATLRPIAGTRRRGKNEQEDRRLADELLHDPKERAEHLMLVDLGRNDLGRVAQTGTVQVTGLMFVERYSHVMHLVSNITCDLRRDCDAFDLLKATFPAGTLSGAPKVRAMEIIAELESEPRGPYGGAVGYLSFTGNVDLAITIRTAEIRGKELIVRAGAGVVADSDPDSEHQESVNKAMALARAVDLISAGGAE